jgi:excisionase family DNA binding protein
MTPRESRGAVNGDSRSHVLRALVLPAARLVDVAGAARYLGVSRRSVFRMLEAGALSPVRLPGVRALRLDVRDLERLVDAGKVGS